MTFAEHLQRANGNALKARRTFIAERRWKNDEWYREWPRGLAVEVNDAIKEDVR